MGEPSQFSSFRGKQLNQNSPSPHSSRFFRFSGPEPQKQLRLSRFRTALSLRGMTGHLICFDFQKAVLGQYFRETASIETIDLKNR